MYNFYRLHDTAWMRGEKGIVYTDDALFMAMMIIAHKSKPRLGKKLVRQDSSVQKP